MAVSGVCQKVKVDAYMMERYFFFVQYIELDPLFREDGLHSLLKNITFTDDQDHFSSFKKAAILYRIK